MNTDILILGGGLVGLTAANLCAQQGFSVIVIERQVPTLIWDGADTVSDPFSIQAFDSRCSAISHKAQKIFESLNIWEKIKQQRVSPYTTMQVWDGLGFGEITFTAAEVNQPDLGHIIENRVMIKALWEAAVQDSNITLQTPASPVALSLDPEKPYLTLTLEDNTQIQAKLLIGADGAQSWLRQAVDIPIEKTPYHQAAIVATVRTEFEHQATAWQRFLPEGPIAFLPLTEAKTSSIVWTTSEEKAKRLLTLSKEAFCAELTQAFDYRLGQVVATSTPLSFPLAMQHAKQYVKDRIALIGDAIHVIHPLAGQGVNLGIEDAEAIVNVLTEAQQKNQDIGNFLVLRKYERARKGAVRRMIAAMAFFKNTFGSKISWVSAVRSFGLHAVGKLGFLKKMLIEQALG